MENHSPERKFEDRMNKNISIEDLRDENANKILSLRKEKRNKETLLNLRGKMNILYEQHYSIHFNYLKTNNDDIRNYYINFKDETTMDKLKYLLQSDDDNEVKYGLLATRKCFQNLIRELYYNDEKVNLKISKDDMKICKELDIFINNNIIDLIFQIMNKSINKNEKQYFINIYESIWIFINMTSAIPEEIKNKNEFFKTFVKEEYLNIFINIIKNINTPQEIITNLLVLLLNITSEEKIILDKLINSPLIQVLFSYLKTNKNINSDILVRIYKILDILFQNLQNFNKLDIDAYKTLFKIFSLPLYNFKNKYLLYSCLAILNLLSEQDNPQIEHFFNDYNLFSAFNNIIFNENSNDNDSEVIINLILDIFYNLILKENNEFQTNFIKSGRFLIFFNNLLIKLKKEKKENKTIGYKIEMNILYSVNNIIMLNHSDSIKYILGEGKEILNFIMESGRSIYRNTRRDAIKSFVNILSDEVNEIDIKIIFDILNIIIDTLNIDNFNNCFHFCVQAIFLIINKSIKNKFENDLKIYLNKKALMNYIENNETQLLNYSQYTEMNDGDINNCKNLIDEIKNFLNN